MHFTELMLLVQFSPEKFVETMHLMEHRYGAKDFVTSKDCSLLAPGTYYLTEVDYITEDFMPRSPWTALVRIVRSPMVTDPSEPATVVIIQGFGS